MDAFLALFKDALSAIKEPRFFDTERGYQGELIFELRKRLPFAAFEGEPVIEQEYQKTLPKHGITIRPDLIIHIPFERGTTATRINGNFVAVEIKLRASAEAAEGDFESLRLLKERMGYPITIFLNLDSSETHTSRCPAIIAEQTACFAVCLRDDEAVVLMERCGRKRPSA